MNFPIPMKALGAMERHSLIAALHNAGPSHLETPRLLACLWLHLCYEAKIAPDEARQGRPCYQKILQLWAHAAAGFVGTCSHALGIHQGPGTAAMATNLSREALTIRSTANVSAPSLFL